MAVKEFALPDLGEGLTESEIVEWHVAVGDLVTLNQPIAEVETAKAIVSLPSPVAGKIAALHAEPGATVVVGARIVTFELEGDAGSAAGDGEKMDASGTEEPAAAPAPERNSVLVGYGPAVETGKKPTRKARTAKQAPESSESTESPESPASPASTESPESPTLESADSAAVPAVPAATSAEARTKTTPPVRKLAHDLGVDLTQVRGTGSEGLITRDDVSAAATAGDGGADADSESGAGHALAARPTETTAGEATAGAVTARVGASRDRPREQRTSIKSVRKATAAAMVSSAFTAPHVTEFLTIDVTRTIELVARLKAAGTAASVLAVVAKALCIGVARNPSLNSRWDSEANEIIEFGYVNLGIAVATPRGLMVPNLKDAELLSLAELTDAIGVIARDARASKATPTSLSGGTISITNVGVFGIDAGTPILNPGEAAILALGAVRKMPWEYRGEVALREVMTLSLSFDHRLVDGEQGARFLTDVGAILSDPGTVLSMM